MTDPVPASGPALPTLRDDRGAVDVLVIGSPFCDVVFAGLPGLPGPGDEVWADSCSIVPGGTYITAAALHRLGVSTAWACRFGTDPFSQFVRDAARREGMDPAAFIEIDGPLRNISVALSLPTDRSFISFAEPIGAIPLTAIDELRPRMIVRPGMGEPADLERLIDAADAVGAIVFVDPQSSRLTLQSAEARAVLGRVGLFAPNEREVLLMTGQDDLDAAVTVLLESTPLAIIKRGALGAFVADRSSQAHAPAIAVEAVETTGAGDCFNAGFIMAMLEGADAAGCLRAGNAAGGLSTTAPSSSGIPTRRQVDLAMAT